MSSNKFFVLIMMVGCASLKDVVSIKYPSTKDSKYIMEIPDGYTFSGVSGDYEVEHRYVYSDSSMIFVTNFTNTPNYDILRNDSLYYKKFQANVLSEDTLVLEGKTDMGYWKDVTYGKMSIGYQRVSENKKDQYDGSLNSFKKRAK